MPDWLIRIVGHDVKPASWFLANEKNFRIHPAAQSAATRGSLNELGWVKAVTVNKRTSPAWGPDQGIETLLDGHDRIKLSLQQGDDTPVPLDYVDLEPSEENAALLLLDEITAMAGKDREKLDELLQETKPSDADLQQMLSDLAINEGIIPPNFAPVGIDEQGRLDEKAKVTCPECGCAFTP